MCPDGFVYNLEINDTHTYTVNGVVVSNCHRIAGRTWQTIHDGYPQAFHIGLTATPCRSDHKGLGSWFDEIVLGPTVRELIDGGYLSKYRIFAPTMPDLSKVHAVAGDFDQRELDEVLRRTTIVGDTVADYKKYNMGKRGLIFTWSVQASVDIARQFQDAGIPAAHIDGETDSQTRDAAVQAFRDNRIKILSNCSIVTEGFNLVGVEICDILKPTKSVGLYLQMVGRALRAAPDKQEARIYDRSGNWARLGLPDDEREWTLEGLDASKRKKKKEPQQTTKVCVSCWMVVARTVAICPTCGYVFPVQPMEADTADGELQELDIEALRIRQVKQEQANAKDLQSLIRVGKARGMRSPYGWAVNVLKAREAKKAAKEIAKAARAEDEERWLAGW